MTERPLTGSWCLTLLVYEKPSTVCWCLTYSTNAYLL